MLAIKFILLVLSVFNGYITGYLLTEKYPLSRYKIFDFEAFKCRPCLSFHIAWVTSTIISLALNDIPMAMVGIAFAFMLFLGLRKDENNKTLTTDEYDRIFNK